MYFSEEKLKEILVNHGHIDEREFDDAVEAAKEKNTPLDVFLVEKGLIDDNNLGKIFADTMGYPFIELKKANIEEISEELLNYIPAAVAQSQKAIVFKEEGGILYLATTKPDNYEFIKNLERITGNRVEIYYTTPFSLEMALRRYGGDLQKEAMVIINEIKKNPVQSEQLGVKLVNLFFDHAYTNLVSDVHIEPLAESAIVRFRIDGILFKVLDYPKELHDRLISRIKILSRLRTDERAAPQDGRFSHEVGQKMKIDVRVSIMPTTEGENAVMRILMQQGKKFNIESLGLLDNDLLKLKKNAKKPWGMILVVGPTGSGKTTTLYAVLQLLNVSGVNIMTIEDPVEYNMEGVQQTQVNFEKKLTFASGLRSIVRQDPDIVMVGEIRDEETAKMAVESAMTGHLVLSTMHANDAATAFPRLLEMKVESFLIASSINICIAQRLVRKICESCRQSYFLNQEEIDIISDDDNFIKMIKSISRKNDLKKIRFFKGKGCDLCNNTGYEGRTSIFEILEVSEKLRKLIQQKSFSEIIREKSIEEGMTPMVYDGILKALMGLTTIIEIKKSAKS